MEEPLLDRIASALEAANAKPKSPEDRQHAKDDLRAQEGMAVWAKRMFIATCASVFFTMLGIWLVWLNLHEARKVTREAIRSADAAGKTVIEAEKATAAANLTAETTREIGVKQIQAYLGFGEVRVRINAETNSLTVAYKLENKGTSPAREVRTRVTVAILTNVRPQKTIKRNVNWGDIMGEETRTPQFPIADYADLISAFNSVWVRIEITGGKNVFGHTIEGLLQSPCTLRTRTTIREPALCCTRSTKRPRSSPWTGARTLSA